MRVGAQSCSNMSSTSCVQGSDVDGVGHHNIGGGYHPAVLSPQSPSEAWIMHNTIVKQEVMESDHRVENDSGISSTYTTGSDRFPSASPESSNHSSHESSTAPLFPSPTHSDNIPNAFYGTSVVPVSHYYPQSRYHHPILTTAYNNVPNFQPMTSPKLPSQAPVASSPNLPEISAQPAADTLSASPISSHLTTLNQPRRFSHSSDSEENDRKYLKHEPPSTTTTPPPDAKEVDNNPLTPNPTFEKEDDEIRKPRMNSHGKVKLHKCKQCSFVGITKLEFWEHSGVHIKAEKRLDCPRCPFVTEYKHHLEYHLRNHFGSKPFACTRCKYTCVNKSMLNSHMKSHSEVYQYGCANCSYVTKYCHSLKLHLRKYDHEPAVVLNPDGTPNPLPIIDVYGTRRGPKQRPVKQQPPSPQPEELTAPNIPPPQMMYPRPFLMQNGQPAMPFPLGSLLNAFQNGMQHPVMFLNNQESPIQPVKDHSTVPSQPLSPVYNNNNNEKLDTGMVSSSSQEVDESFERNTEALDLTSRPDGNTTPSIMNPILTSASRNRRKGRAFKIGHVALQRQHESTSDDDDQPQKKQRGGENAVEEDSRQGKEAVLPSDVVDVPKTFSCTFCDIDFKDEVLHAMHMGFHGYQEPFTCNGCGEKTADKVSFFLHLARTRHN